MYEEFFKWKENPFCITPDPSYLFLSRRHTEALNHLRYGIESRKGFIQITGEIGTGKTTLCRALLNSLNSSTRSALILNPTLSENQLLENIIEDFGIPLTKRSRLSMLKALNQFLLEELARGHNCILIIDEAQNIKPSQLEHLRLLSNLETAKEKLLQIILVGQPELKEKLNVPQLKQLRQRIVVRYHIQPLERDEVLSYIKHRMRVAGCEDSANFTSLALEKIYFYSQGVPRLINALCEKALLCAYTLETHEITEEVIGRAEQELEGIIV
ncbi:MAG: AAA family ATPase [Candidatus Omnitrophica bacterium]|nr:AAA family ATPase [Candidatus Omnitrophota bacterium]